MSIRRLLSGPLFSGALFAALAALCLCVLAGVKLQAQTAHAGKILTLGSGFANPFTVAVDANENVAVIDYGNHAVKEIMAAGGYTTVRTLAAGLSFMFGSAFDSHGNLFFTEYGKDHVDEILAVNGVIPPSPKIIVLPASGFNIPAGVAVDANGNLFIGDQNNNAVKEITASSGYTTTITLGTGFSTPDGVAVDQHGNVFVANDGGNTVDELVAVNGVVPPLSTPVVVATGFSQPFDVAVDGGGNVYVADRGNSAVKEIMAVNGVIPASPTIVPLGVGFATPTGVTVDSNGNVFVADNGNSLVKEIQYAGANFGQVSVGTAATAIPVTFTFDTGGPLGSSVVVSMGNFGMDFYNAGGGTCAANITYNPGDTCTVNVGFAPLAPGPRYGAVKLLTTGGALIGSGPLQGIGVGPQATFAVTTSGFPVPSATANAGSGFNGPGGAAVDANGDIFIADTFHGAIKEIMNIDNSWTNVNTLGGSFLFDYPNGVAVDGGGNVYVADTLNDAVEEIVATGGYAAVNTLGSGFSSPYAVAVDGYGNVFVANYSPGTVQEMMAVGGRIPGSPSIRTLASGINGPDGLAVDGNGNVFVADYGDGTVLEIHAVNGSVPASPVITTIATGFSGPSNLSVDAAANVFVADTDGGEVIELVASSGYATQVVLGGTYSAPEATAVWNGDVIVADAVTNKVSVLEYANAPALTFATTMVGSTSSDSPQRVTVSNGGNAPLTFPLPGTGTNPSIPINFGWDNSSTCLQLTTSSPQAFSLAGGTSCSMAFDFKPTASGSFSNPAVVTDNNLNVPNSTQSIQLNGTGTVPPVPAMSTPAPGSTLGGPTIFTWTPGSGVANFQVYVGTTGAGSHDLYQGPDLPGTTTSSASINIPSNGVTLYVRLWYLVGTWKSLDYTYTETSAPVIISPSTSTPIGGATVFTWNPASTAVGYQVYVGTTGAGSHNLYTGPDLSGSTTSSASINIPNNGASVNVRLWYEVGTTWKFVDYVYTEMTAPAMISPSGASVLSGPTTFTWSPGTGVTTYQVYVGTTGAGSHNIYTGPDLPGTATSSGPINVPKNGVTVYVRLWYVVHGAWLYQDHTFVEAL